MDSRFMWDDLEILRAVSMRAAYDPDQKGKLRAATSRYPIRAIADAREAKMSIAVRAAFAVGRRRLPNTNAAITATAVALGVVLPKLLLAGLEAGGAEAARGLRLRVAYSPDQSRDDQGQWTSGGASSGASDVPYASSPDTETLEANSGYAFFSRESDKWTRASDYEARQNAYDMAMRDTPSLGRELRKAYFGVSDEELPEEVSLYRVGGVQEGVNSFFPRLAGAEAYQRRFDVEGISKVVFDPKRLVPTGTGAGEIWAHSDDVLRKERMRNLANKPIQFRFDAQSPEAKAWAKQHAAKLIKGITETTRDKIIDIIARIGNKDDAIDEIAEFLGDEARAETIARTETMTAVHEGQRQAWDQATEAGLLTGDEKRVWITTPDDRLCEICEPLDNAEADLDGLYPGDIEAPPAHVNCRCTEGLL